MGETGTMKVVHFSTTDFGGAYKAAERIHAAMNLCGAESRLLVRTKTRSDTAAEAYFDNGLQRFWSKVKNVGNLLLSRGEIISDYFGTNVSKHPLVQEADAIILHWVNSFIGYRNVEQLLRLGKPVIWVMHDMWLFTGGCHIDGYCGRYEYGCGKCPYLNSDKKNDISGRNFIRKRRMLYEGNIALVGPSKWITECAVKSGIVRGRKIEIISNPINTKIFFPRNNKDLLKKKYKLPTDKFLILFGAMKATEDRNKGFAVLQKVISGLDSEKYAVVVFGNTKEIHFTNTEMHVTGMGMIGEEDKLAEIYNCADVFAAPSMQESFGYTVCEALACGVPVAGFDIGGMRDQIAHGVNGYLAERNNADDLLKGILYCIHTIQNGVNLRLENTFDRIGNQYCELITKPRGGRKGQDG